MTTDKIIAAAREAGLTTGDNQKHDGVYWWRSLGRPTNVSTTDLAAFYAIAYRAGMERAAEIADESLTWALRGDEISDRILAEAHAKNQPESTHDTGNV